MNALFRYLLLKAGREGWLAGFILAPAVALLSPFLVYAVYLGVRGEFTWPMVIDRNTLAALRGAPEFLVMISGVVAASMSFLAFAQEMGNGAIGAFVLAARPRSVVAVSALFGTAWAVAACFMFFLAVALVRTGFAGGNAVHSNVSAAVIGGQLLLVSACGAAAGVAMASISPLQPMMVPAYAIAMANGIVLTSRFGAAIAAAAIVETLVLLAAATILMRRRCAA